MSTATTHVVVDGRDAIVQLASLDQAFDAAGACMDAMSISAQQAAAKIRKAMENQALGVPVMKEIAERVSAEQYAYERLAARVDPIMAQQVKAQRERARAVAAVTNAVVAGVTEEAAGLRTLNSIEAIHIDQMRKLVAANNNYAASSDHAAIAATHLAAAEKSGAHIRQNLLYQYNDVAVSLAGGMSPLTVAMQQGSQILSGPGGLNGALKETGNLAKGLVTKFWPIALAVGAVSLAVAGMTSEINELGGVQVSFGDTALAVWQTFADRMYTLVKPAIDAVAPWFQDVWDRVVQATHDTGNTIIQRIQGAMEIIKTAINTLGPAFLVAGETAANNFLQGIAQLVNGSLAALQTVIDKLNAAQNIMNGDAMRKTMGLGDWFPDLPNAFDPNKPWTPDHIDIGGAAAVDELNGAYTDLGKTLQGIADSDPMGDFFGDVRTHAIQNATDRLAENAKATDGAAKAAKAHKAALDEQAKAAEALAKSIETTLGSALTSLFSGPLTDIDDAMGRILGSFAQLGQANLSKAFDGMLSGLQTPAGADPVGSMPPWAAIGDFVRQGAQIGTEKGSVNGLESLMKGIGGSNAMPMLSTALGGAGIGYQTQNPLMGALGGALPGLMTGNPFTAIAGGLTGKVGGMFGKPSATPSPKKEESDDRDHLCVAA